MLRSLVPLVSTLALTACGGDPDNTAEAEPSGPATETSAADQPAAEAGGDADSDAQAILAALGSDYADADLGNGARQFRRCQSCHTLNEGGRHTVGPNLHGIVGAAAASAEGFSYSRQLSESGLVWDAATLDAWVENPRTLVPGNRMSFVGLRDAQDRRDVIAYMAVETAD
jgi:cytochrome c